MREPRDTDFFIPLPDVGKFRYGRRTYGDRLKIRSEFLSLTQDVGDDDPDIAMYAGCIANHRVLCVEAPPGWEDIAAIDLTSRKDADAKILELFTLLNTTEDSFAKGVEKSGEAAGSGGA